MLASSLCFMKEPTWLSRISRESFLLAQLGTFLKFNLAEFYYKAAIKKGVDTADNWYRQIRQFAFQIVPPDEEITRSAGLWKVERNDLSLADCFALATTQQKAQIPLTTDRILAQVKEIRSVHVPA